MSCRMIWKNKLLMFVPFRVCDGIFRRINAHVEVMLKSLSFRCDVTDLNFPEPQPSNPFFHFFVCLFVCLFQKVGTFVIF